MFMPGAVSCFRRRILLALIAKMPSREEAYQVVQSIAMKAIRENIGFKELVMDSPIIGKYMTPAEINKCFDIGYYTKHVPQIIKRALK